MLSPRNLHFEVWRGYHYEFENIICEIDGVELIAPGPLRRGKIERVLRQKAKEWFSVAPPPPPVQQMALDGSYDLFFAVMVGVPDVDLLEKCKGWRQRSRVAGCWVDEIWLRYLGTRKQLEALKSFDFIYVACEATIEPLQEAIGRPCSYIAPAVDALSFCPYPELPKRTIDVYSIGRRPDGNHRALIELARQRKLHYVFDTTPVRYAHDLFDHRLLLAKNIQRSRFFCVDVAKANVPEHRGRQQELGYRFFEGAAGGALLAGRAPKTRSFEENFDWPGAVLELPDSPEQATQFFLEYAENERAMGIRRNNVVNCLRRHDWVYRWETILETAGLKSLDAAEQRKARLESTAAAIEKIQITA